MSIKSFLDQASTEAVHIHTEKIPSERKGAFQNESLFHIPLIAMAVLMIAKGRSKPKAEEIGQIIGECFENTLAGFKGSSQELGWSANLRMRTAKAVTFLEVSGLISKELSTEKLEATEKGRTLIEKVIANETNLSLSLLEIKRAYRHIYKERALSLELQ